jgi:hypothetical protein
LAGLGARAPVKNLDETLSSQKFHPSIEKRMRDGQAEPLPDQNPKCQEAEENGRPSCSGGNDGAGRVEGGRTRLPVVE